MTLGICLKGLNVLYFGDKLDFYHEVIPQILLLMSIVGYMDFLIISKWAADFTNNTD